jgi:hypothetical protein
VHRAEAERLDQSGGVVGHVLDREAVGGHRRPAGAPVVERGQPVAVGEGGELGLPRLGGVAESGEEQDVGACSLLDVPQLGVADRDESLVTLPYIDGGHGSSSLGDDPR